MLQRLLNHVRGRPEIKVGVVTSLSGPLQNYAIQVNQGLELGVEYATGGSYTVAGRPLQLLVEDDGGDPDVGGRKARALIEEGAADVLEGCVSSAVAIQVARVAREHQRVFLIDPAAADVLTGEWFNRYVFRAAPNVSQDAAAGAQYAVEHLGRTFCFLAPDYVFGHQSRSAWWRAVEKYGGKVVGDILAAPDETDFEPYLNDVLAAEPDVLMVSWAGSGVKRLFAQMQDMGLFDTLKITGNLIDRETLHAVGHTIAGMVCAARYYRSFPQNPVNDWFVQGHQARYGAPPDLFAASGFAAGLALVQALERTGGDPEAEALIPAMEGMSFEGPKGTYTFRPEDHQALQPMYVVEMVKHPEQPYCVPQLIREVSAQASAPPVVEPRQP